MKRVETVAETTERARNRDYPSTYALPGALWAEREIEKSEKRAIEGKERPWISLQNRPDVDGDWNQRNISLAMELMDMSMRDDVDITDDSKLPVLVERFKDVWVAIAKYGMKPMVTHFSACLGMSGMHYKNAVTLGVVGGGGSQRVAPQTQRFMQRNHALCEQQTTALVADENGGRNQVGNIFLSKVWYDYREAAEVVIRTEDPLHTLQDANAIADRYLADLPAPALLESVEDVD